MSDFFVMLVFLAAVVVVFNWVRQRIAAPTQQGGGSSAKPQAVSTNQMAEDIKATKTSRVVDAVSILDDLSETSSNYRHYCELVGTSMASGGVTAPYSRRQVAYYDIKCYRLDATYGGEQTETLIAHEHSFDPFFFTDTSCDTPVYVDLESFGNNVILVNSTNHVEGPNSDFAQALKKSVGNATSGGVSAAYAMVAHAVERGANALLGAVDGLRGSSDTLRQGLAQRQALQPVFACAGASDEGNQRYSATALQLSSRETTATTTLASPSRSFSALRRLKFFGRGGGPNAPSAHGGSNGRFSGPQQRPGSGRPSSQPQIHINVGYGNRPPQHLGDFMGPYGGGPWVMGGGPGYSRPRPHNNDDAAILLGMGLGALLNSMSASQQQSAQGYTTSTDTFRGYRLVENVVPLGSPIYCIGEIYRNGTDVYMSRSLAKDYPTSYFATKPEAEVLSSIEGR